MAFSLGKENPKAPHLHNTLPWHNVGCGRQPKRTNCARILHLVLRFVEEFCTTTSQFSSCWLRERHRALRPEARSKGWFQGSVSEENSPRRLPPNHCGDRLEKFAAKFAAKFARKFATKFAARFCATHRRL